jgi:magnesium transporter
VTAQTDPRPDGLVLLGHTADGRWTKLASFDELDEFILRSRHFVWIDGDISSVSHDDIEELAARLELHPLAVEDARRPRQRPKLEQYDNHMFAVLHELNVEHDQLEANQIACFIGRRYAFVLHAGSHRLVDETRRRLVGTQLEKRQGAAFLVHTLLDTVVDDYEAIADRIEDEVEELEELALAQTGTQVLQRIYPVKQQLARLRRYVLPASRVLASVVEEGHATGGMLTSSTGAFFRDVYDHTLRITDQIRSVDDLANAILDLVQLQQSNTQNEATKRLTAWAAIVAVPTFLASVLGMNVLFPGEGTVTGFWAAFGSMVALAAVLYVFFKRRQWI